MHEAPEKTRSRRPRISERRLLIAGLVAALIVVAGALITRPDEALSRAVANRVVAAAAAHGVVVELGRARLLPFSVEFGVIEATARRPAGLPATARIDASRVVVAWVPTLSPRLGVRLTTARIEGAHAVVEDPRPAAATSAPATPAPGPAAPARPAARRATSTASTWWSLERVDAAGISVQAPGMRVEVKLVLPQGRRLDTAWQGAKGFFAGGLFLLRAYGQGKVWFSTYGALHTVDIGAHYPGYICDNSHLVGFTQGLQYSVRKVGGLKSLFFSGEGLVCEFNGKGRLWMQTRNPASLAAFLHPFRSVQSNS